MISARTLLFIILSAILPAIALSEDEPQTAPIPSDPLELATGPIQVVDTPECRAAMVKLLNPARQNYRLESAGRGYDLKMSFVVDSGGVTQYDGAWQMEDIFAPGPGPPLDSVNSCRIHNDPASHRWRSLRRRNCGYDTA
jgi:hypothetical protein